MQNNRRQKGWDWTAAAEWSSLHLFTSKWVPGVHHGRRATPRDCWFTWSKALTTRRYLNHLSGITRACLQGRLQGEGGQPPTICNQSLLTTCAQGCLWVLVRIKAKTEEKIFSRWQNSPKSIFAHFLQNTASLSKALNRQLRNLEYGNNICTLEVCVYNYFLTMFTVMWVRLLQKNGIIKVVWWQVIL